MSQSVKTLDTRQSWKAWAATKIGRRQPAHQNNDNDIITLFPGWAVRKYNPALAHLQPAPFEVEVFVSGYAMSCKPKEQASRSQRAFIRLAKGFASLPRLDSQDVQAEAYQAQLIDEKLQRAKANQDSESDSEPESYETTPVPHNVNTTYDLLQKLHHNLESRLQLFWSSTLPSRTIRLHLFASPHHSSSTEADNDSQNFNIEDHKPLATKDVITTVDGSFNTRFHVNWHDLCHHPKALHIAFGESIQEHDLLIIAELLPPPTISSPSSPNSIPSQYPYYSSNSSNGPQAPPPPPTHHHHHRHIQNLLNTLPSSLKSLSNLISPTSTATSHIRIPITHSPIRVISDIDDTVKLSSVTEGARAVFHNVFVKELKDGVIPGMGEWYSDMWRRGVRFHYVSNGPYEYLNILSEFFKISKLPPGSIKLKSYAGRSLLAGLLSTPAERKRAGVVEILDSFSSNYHDGGIGGGGKGGGREETRFILIGDSGEQDLELYADLARERPEQVLAVFIRDAEELLYPPIDDPIGWSVALPCGDGDGDDGNSYGYGYGYEDTTTIATTATTTATATGEFIQGQLYNSPPQTLFEPQWITNAEKNTLENENENENEGGLETKTPTPKQKNVFLELDPLLPASGFEDNEYRDTTRSVINSNSKTKTNASYITKPPPPIVPLTISIPSTSTSSTSSSSGFASRSRSSSNDVVDTTTTSTGNGNGRNGSKYGIGMGVPVSNINTNMNGNGIQVGNRGQGQLQYSYQPQMQMQMQARTQTQMQNQTQNQNQTRSQLPSSSPSPLPSQSQSQSPSTSISRKHRLVESMRSLSGSISGFAYGSGSGSGSASASASGSTTTRSAPTTTTNANDYYANGQGLGSTNTNALYQTRRSISQTSSTFSTISTTSTSTSSNASTGSSSSLDPSSIWWGSGLEQNVVGGRLNRNRERNRNNERSGSGSGSGNGVTKNRNKLSQSSSITKAKRSTSGSGNYSNGNGNGPLPGNNNNNGKMTEKEKKRWELQERVYRARTLMPSHIPLRIFREPVECFEDVDRILGMDGDGDGDGDGDVGR